MAAPKFDLVGGVELPAADRKVAPASAAVKSPRKSTWSISHLLLVAIIAHSALIVGATVYILKSVVEVRKIDSRLEALSAFEGRINEKISEQNIGVQNLINETNARLSTIRSDVEALNAASQELSRKLDQLANWITSRSDFSGFRAGPANTGDGSAAPDAASTGSDGAGLPAPSGGYRRIKGADGSVTYEKIR